MINNIYFMCFKYTVNKIRVSNVTRDAPYMFFLKKFITFGSSIFSDKRSECVLFFLNQFSAKPSPDKASDTSDQNIQYKLSLIFLIKFIVVHSRKIDSLSINTNVFLFDKNILYISHWFVKRQSY